MLRRSRTGQLGRETQIDLRTPVVRAERTIHFEGGTNDFVLSAGLGDKRAIALFQ